MATAGKSQMVVLIVVAVILGACLYALDRYSDGQKDMVAVETRGMQMVSALTRYKQDNGKYPEALDRVVPKYAQAVSKCPDGQNMTYRLEGAEFVLVCQNVVFKQQPYTYSSASRNWS